MPDYGGKKKIVLKFNLKFIGGFIMPIVQIDMLEGRTVEQKRELVRKVTAAICETASCSPEAVKIVIRDMSKDNYGDGGKLRSDF